MSNDANTDSNQTPATIRLPDCSTGVENPPEPPAPQKPDEHVPPVEVPGRQDVPQPIPEKSVVRGFAYPMLVKNGKR